MGLTRESSGKGAADRNIVAEKKHGEITVALSGNPNVGKSTVFNYLTGLNQHTGNWPGKTVCTMSGSYIYSGKRIILYDIPGSYSLSAHSKEEEVARDFVCFGNADINVVVCDASCIERNLNLALQTTEVSEKTILCINLMDEAKKRDITIDADKMSRLLGIPVVATAARSGKGLDVLSDEIVKMADIGNRRTPISPDYAEIIKVLIKSFRTTEFDDFCKQNRLRPDWLALQLLEDDGSVSESLSERLNLDIRQYDFISNPLNNARKVLEESNISPKQFTDMTVEGIMKTAEQICAACVKRGKDKKFTRDRKIDKILTSRVFGFPIMFIMLAVIFWITLFGANYPSAVLSELLFSFEDSIYSALTYMRIPAVVCDIAVFGVYRVVAWIISVMLPPMAIFFPLFTLLEDLGYLPRVAFNLDRCFKKCSACGKQSLTMCMGFGCNAAGVVGCRIIDSPRERMIAILTNSFVPCNGRFPTLISIITMFFIGRSLGIASSIVSALILAMFIILSILMTLLTSYILSKTVLKGVPSSYTLELPSYRSPQILKIIVRSIFDRTLFVLMRAIVAAAPAGLLIWIAANVDIGGVTLLNHIAGFLDPFASLLGLDGIILLAFILGLPANEIVIPIMIMAYTCSSTINDIGDLNFIKTLFINNGWTILTALNVMLFSLFHWPCATTLMTIKKESGSLKWTALAFLLPTVAGIILCILTTLISKLF